MRVIRLAIVVAVSLFALGLTPSAKAQSSSSAAATSAGTSDSSAPTQASDSADASTPAIPPGTIINSSNWSQYKQFMSDGLIGLWEGRWFWKMPAEAQIKVGPTMVYPLPSAYVAASEKFGDQTQIEKASDGRWRLKNYVAGVPFPIPSDPNKGQKILTNLNYRIQPHLIAGYEDSGAPLTVCNLDKMSNVLCWKLEYNVRQLAYNWEPGVPQTEPTAQGAWLGIWIDVLEPEQYRYATDLLLYWQDNLTTEDNFLFVPALRHSLRLSDASHCSRAFTFADFTHDDTRGGWNGGIADFDATFIKRMKLLGLVQANNDYGKFPDNYLMPLGFAKPSWGDWELRDTWVIDVRPAAALKGRYCYGKRIVYVDTNTYAPLAQDLYNTKMEFNKVMLESLTPADFPGSGKQTWTGGGIGQIWDVITEHAAFGFTADEKGNNWTIDGAVKPQYNNPKEYQDSGAVMHMMR
ncbi:MAG TPA: DUF1329 domain-containing protein [Candidatus Binataceae bacterium]|nr:DUF1329 domain-containing protein [Candidatus Binataceae bacterium]